MKGQRLPKKLILKEPTSAVPDFFLKVEKPKPPMSLNEIFYNSFKFSKTSMAILKYDNQTDLFNCISSSSGKILCKFMVYVHRTLPNSQEIQSLKFVNTSTQTEIIWALKDLVKI